VSATTEFEHQVAFDRRQLVDTVKKAVCGHAPGSKLPSSVLKPLVEMNFHIIITTDCDFLINDALIAKGKQPIPSSYCQNEDGIRKPTGDYDEPSPAADRPFVLKSLGDITSDLESIVFTVEDYFQWVCE
jgi:hypothetical protein